MRWSRKPLCVLTAYREFESPPLRQFDEDRNVPHWKVPPGSRPLDSWGCFSAFWGSLRAVYGSVSSTPATPDNRPALLVICHRFVDGHAAQDHAWARGLWIVDGKPQRCSRSGFGVLADNLGRRDVALGVATGQGRPKPSRSPADGAAARARASWPWPSSCLPRRRRPVAEQPRSAAVRQQERSPAPAHSAQSCPSCRRERACFPHKSRWWRAQPRRRPGLPLRVQLVPARPAGARPYRGHNPDIRIRWR